MGPALPAIPCLKEASAFGSGDGHLCTSLHANSDRPASSSSVRQELG